MKRIIGLVLVAVALGGCGGPKMALVELVEVPGGSMVLGNEEKNDNKPHKVTLDSFYMAQYPVTLRLWKQFLTETGLKYDWDWKLRYIDITFRELMDNDDYAAQGLDWYYAVAFCNWLSRKEGLQPAYTIKGKIVWDYEKEQLPEPEVFWNKKANGYRLPTEAEWEYAARGGPLSKGYRYAGSDNPEEIGRFSKTYGRPYPVGQHKPNELGLYDMGGNVSAWCWDWYDAKAWALLPEHNPSLDRKEDIKNKWEGSFKAMKVLRGTDWDYMPRPVYARGTYPPVNIGWVGIRLVRSKFD